MHYCIDAAGSIHTAGSETDGDLDIAAALVFAYKKWGLYENSAREIINSILAHDVEDITNVLRPGDVFGGIDSVNPSYFAISYMKIFADFTGITRWIDVREKTYNILLKAAHPQTGLVPDWGCVEGIPGGGPPGIYYSEDYYYDASRTPRRIALDYLWYGDARAKDF